MDVDDPTHSLGPNAASIGSMASSSARRIDEEEDVDRYNTELQESLLEEGTKTPGKEREAYERFLDIFPTAGAVWLRYVNFERHQGDMPAVEALFNRSLVQSVNVELWIAYTRHVEFVTSTNAKLGPMDRKKKVKESFEYAIGHIGLDMDATMLWENYIGWLKKEGYEPMAICDVYVRALTNPMQRLDQLYRDYEKFTEKLPRAPSAAELSAKHATAKRVFDDRLKQTEGLTKNVLAKPPRRLSHDARTTNASANSGAFSNDSLADGASSANSGANPADSNQPGNDLHQARLWKQLIEFEKSNPQDLDENKLTERVTFTFNQALVALYHYPEIWLQAAQYQLSIGKIDASKMVYASALKVLPKCLLLYFEFAEFLELNNFSKESDVLYQTLTKTHFSDNELVWIQYMYYCRRVHGIQSARKVFFKLRKLEGVCTHHSYVAAAQLEYYVNKDPHVARKVFELGYHLYEHEPLFLTHYVEFLYHQSEDSHMRVLFEKILANLPPAKSLELWNRFIKFETICGNLEPAVKLQSRRSAAYPGMDPAGVLAAVQRYRFLDLWPVSEAELSSFDNAYEIAEDGANDDNDAQDDATDGKSRSRAKGSSETQSKDQDATASQQVSIVLPDLKQMQLYKGTGVAGQSATSTTLSFKLDELMGRLPSARDWSGPMVNIELLMQSILNYIEIPYTAGPARHAAQKAEIDEEESGLQARAKESAMAGEQFRHKITAIRR